MIFLGLLFALLTSNCCENNEWNNIVPLKTTRAEAENILGVPYSVGRRSARYDTPTDDVFVVYATRPCSIRPSPGDVPEALVTMMEVTPKNPPKLVNLKLDLRKFDKSTDAEKYLDYYTDRNDGISFILDIGTGTVTQFTYTPQKAFAEHFCKQYQ